MDTRATSLQISQGCRTSRPNNLQDIYENKDLLNKRNFYN